MKTLFVVQRYGTHVAGGSEQCCRLFAEHLAARGHEVEVATSCARNYTDWANEFPAGEERINGVRVHRHPRRPTSSRRPVRSSQRGRRVG